MGSRTFTKDFLVNELDLPSNAIQNDIYGTSRWSEHHYIVFEFDGKFYGTSYSCGATEMQDESPWEYVEEVECDELKLATVKKQEYVGIDFVEEETAVTSSGLSFLALPPVNADPIALWAFYNKAEKEAKEGKEREATIALNEVGKTEHKFVRTQFGGAQMISKVIKKPKDTLKFILKNQGQYELCRKDEVDLKKVEELIEAGILDKNEIMQHIQVTPSAYLQLKK
jgi:hypothetical protein